MSADDDDDDDDPVAAAIATAANEAGYCFTSSEDPFLSAASLLATS